MADNVPFQATTLATPASGTSVATDDVAGNQFQRIKVDLGADGATSPLVRGTQASASSIPVVIASDQAAVPISGTITATVTGVATSAKQDTGNTSLASIDGKITAVNTGAVVVSSSALPSGASTSAKQPALGTAGVSSADVISVQGIASGTALPISGAVTVASTTITGNVTVVQPTGTSLHAVLDTTSTTAVTQATGTNLHVVTDATSTTIATQGTATSLKAEVIGAGTAGTANAGVVTVQGIASMTPVQVSQATATNLKAEVVGSGSAGTAATGVVTVQGIASMTKLLVTPDANSAVNVAQINGVTPLMGAGNTGTGSPRVTIATDDLNLAAINAVSGVTTGSAVITDANGTLQQYLRGLIKLLITTANYPAQTFQGSAQTCIDTAVDIAAGNFGATTTTFTNNDAACPNAQYAKCMAEFPDWAAAPVAGTTVDLYVLLKDVDSTDDETDAPSGTANGGAHYCGSFTIAAADALQRRMIVINLWNLGITGSVTGDFYFKNLTAQNMNNDGGTNAVLKVTPFSPGQVV